MGYLDRGSFASRFHTMRDVTMLLRGTKARKARKKQDGEKPAPPAGDANILAGTGIFDSETDWVVLGAGVSVPGNGHVMLTDTSGSGARASEWEPATDVVQQSTTYDTTWCWMNECNSGSGALLQCWNTFMTLNPAHTSGCAVDAGNTTGTTQKHFFLFLHDTNSLTKDTQADNGVYIEMVES